MNNKKRLEDVFEVASQCSPYVKVLTKTLEVYPDFPKKGVNFVDIFPLFSNRYLVARTSSALLRAVDAVMDTSKITAVAGPESRGFLFGVLLAEYLGVPFVPFRKPNKLPCPTVSKEYTLEYGTDSLEFPSDVLTAKDNVLIVDDLLALGGTMEAMIDIIRDSTEASVLAGVTLINLEDLPKPKFKAPVVSVLNLRETANVNELSR